jgi:hypothetical protein
MGFQVWNFNKDDIQSHLARESRAPTKEEMATIAVTVMRAAYAQLFGQEEADFAAGTVSVGPRNRLLRPMQQGPWINGADSGKNLRLLYEAC